MSGRGRFATLHNASAIPRREVPSLDLPAFHDAILAAVERGERVAALFALPDPRGGLELWAVLAADAEGVLRAGTARIEGGAYPALTPECPQIHLFEREIAERWGVRPEGHPWLKPVRFPAAGAPGQERPAVGVMDFYRVEGEEVHEVAVGPVHAGVIEPGHFRFQCHGEDVFHLEISLGYQHRGIERALAGGPGKRTVHYMETLAGDTTIGHATAHAQVVEALAGCRVPPRGMALRGIALELERLANHTGGLGALANDVGFLPTASYCGRLRGDYLNLTAALCGSRFGRGMVRPGGAGFDADPVRAAAMRERLAAANRDVAQAVNLLWSSPSVQARFEDTGPLGAETASDLGLVGVAARACGLERDVRHDHPAGIFQFARIPVSTWSAGDVFARAFVRWLEIQRSGAFLIEQLRALPGGAVRTPCGPPAGEMLAVALVEGWRGEICHVALTAADRRFAAYKVVDPSFHNWMGLALSLRGQQISDFPLCNKSFDLSYCGHDL